MGARMTDERFDAILADVASTDLGVGLLCKKHETTKETFYVFVRSSKDREERYLAAKQLQVEVLIDGILDISDDGSNDWMERLAFKGSTPGWEVNGEHINRSRLRVDTRKWIACHLMPKKYGESKQIDLTASVDHKVRQQALNLSKLPPELLRQIEEHVTVSADNADTSENDLD